jgi:DNA primase
VIIPVSLDQSTTALLAATIESIDRVGPYQTKFTLKEIEDIREVKKREIGERAKEIMQLWRAQKKTHEAEIVEEVHKSTEEQRITSFGEIALPAGPEVETSKELVIVEGRADVQLLLSLGIKNVIATNGVEIHRSLVNLTKSKEKVVAFLDGDRVGDMILKSLLREGAKIDYVARPPKGKEVEELPPTDALSLLNAAEPLSQYLAREEGEKRMLKISDAMKRRIAAEAANVKERLLSSLLDENGEKVAEVPVTELYDKLDAYREVFGIVFDGVVTQRLVDKANSLGIKLIVGERIGSLEKKPESMTIMRLADFSEQV